jgi:LmbE family N-acetylglucosaminyl deacetylase
MHIETGSNAQDIALFLFPHQDDEFGVFHQIESERDRARTVCCVYFTTGVAAAESPAQRNAESLRVLRALAVSESNIHFLGSQLGISDGALPHHTLAVAAWIEKTLLENPSVATVYVPAWEGGHSDHDALHACALQALRASASTAQCFQFPLYHAASCVGPFFRVLSPLAANGYVTRTHISIPKRLRYLGLLFVYRSQWKSWLGLFPFVLLHMIFSGTQALQPVHAQRLSESPHAGLLYYEKRKFSTWAAVCAGIKKLR